LVRPWSLLLYVVSIWAAVPHFEKFDVKDRVITSAASSVDWIGELLLLWQCAGRLVWSLWFVVLGGRISFSRTTRHYSIWVWAGKRVGKVGWRTHACTVIGSFQNEEWLALGIPRCGTPVESVRKISGAEIGIGRRICVAAVQNRSDGWRVVRLHLVGFSPSQSYSIAPSQRCLYIPHHHHARSAPFPRPFQASHVVINVWNERRGEPEHSVTRGGHDAFRDFHYRWPESHEQPQQR
jgi:hypothetical protein